MKAGFSLIEIIIATVLSTMLATVLFNAFYQSNRSLVIVDEFSEIDTNEVIVVHQFSHDLAGTVWLPVPKEEPKKVEQQQALTPATQQKEIKKITKNFVSTTKNKQLALLTFITLNPRAIYNGKPRLVRVAYRLNAHKEVNGMFVLTRQESTDLDFDLFETKGEKRPRELVVCDAVKKCSLEFVYTPTKKTDDKKPESKKVAEWNSDAKNETSKTAESVPPLPQAVIVSLEVADELNKLHRSLTYRIPIYSYEQAIITQAATEQQKAQAPASDEKKPEQPKGPQPPPPPAGPPARPSGGAGAGGSGRGTWTGKGGFFGNNR